MTDHDVDPRIASWLRQEAPPAAAPALIQAIVAATRQTRQRGGRPGPLRGPLLLAGAAAVLLIAVIVGTWWRSPDPVGPEATPVPSTSALPTVGTPSPSADAVATPTFDSPILRLAEIPTADGASGFAGARPHDLVVGGPGLVAVGELSPCCADPGYDDTWEVVIWTSRDGRRWELLPDLETFGKAGLRAVAVDENGQMIAAGYEVVAVEPNASGESFRMEARLWRSTNGIDWVSAPAPEGDVHDIATWRGGWVAVGSVRDDSMVAVSGDGQTWTTHLIGSGVAEHVTVDASGTIVVAGCMLATEEGGPVCESGLATSTDGETWTTERIVDGTVRGMAVRPGGGFIAVGSTDGGSTSWVSAEGLAWESATYEDSSRGGFTAVAAAQDGVIAAEAPFGSEAAGRIWQSFDGQFWTLIAELEPNAAQEVAVTALAFRDAQYIVLGWAFNEGRAPAAWHGP